MMNYKMTVRELINNLLKYDLDTEVRYRDIYWEDMGYGAEASDPRKLTRPVFEVREENMKDGKTAVIVC